MNPSTIYLAGPMRGIRAYNFPSFDAARERLREAGWTVVCPAERDRGRGFKPEGLTGNEDLAALGFDLPSTLGQCFADVLDSEAVAVLPGWARSEGARAEVMIALLSGRPVFAYFHHRPAPLEPLDGVSVVTRVETIR